MAVRSLFWLQTSKMEEDDNVFGCLLEPSGGRYSNPPYPSYRIGVLEEVATKARRGRLVRGSAVALAIAASMSLAVLSIVELAVRITAKAVEGHLYGVGDAEKVPRTGSSRFRQ